jgi:hypothetical protein
VVCCAAWEVFAHNGGVVVGLRGSLKHYFLFVCTPLIHCFFFHSSILTLFLLKYERVRTNQFFEANHCRRPCQVAPTLELAMSCVDSAGGKLEGYNVTLAVTDANDAPGLAATTYVADENTAGDATCCF